MCVKVRCLCKVEVSVQRCGVCIKVSYLCKGEVCVFKGVIYLCKCLVSVQRCDDCVNERCVFKCVVSA